MNCTLDPVLGYVPAVPLPFYVWQRWKWQKVRCGECGQEFTSKSKGFMPQEYERHYVLNHIAAAKEFCE